MELLHGTFEDDSQLGVVGTPSLGGCAVPRGILPVKHSARRFNLEGLRLSQSCFD